MLQVELENVTLGYEQFRQTASKQIKDLQESVSHWKSDVRSFFLCYIFNSKILLINLTFFMIQCLQYQEETKEAKNNCLSLEQRYNGERVKTADVTKVSVLIKIISFG